MNEAKNMKNTSKAEQSNGWVQFFIAPLMTALIMGFLQLWLAPIVEKNKIKETQLWIDKKNLFLEAIALVDKKIDSDAINQPNHQPAQDKPSAFDINRIYSQLLLLSEDKRIPELFRKFFDNSISSYSAADRGDFIKSIKKELTSKDLSLGVEEIPVFFSIKN